MSEAGMPEDRALIELYERFCELRKLPVTPDRMQLVRDFIVHPACQTRLRQASASVLRHSAGRRDLRGDALQEAACLIIRRLDSAELRFRDEGPARFGGWLYALCRNALREAWRRLSAQERRSVATVEPHTLARLATAGAGADRSRDRAGRVFALIHEIEDQTLYHVMIDWAGGLSGLESAQLRGVSPSTVSKRRAQGVELVIRRLREDV